MNPMHQDGVVILDFGSQYTQLIARRIREQHVFSEILSSNTSVDSMMKRKPKAVILSGGPNSVFEDSAPQYDPKIFDLDKSKYAIINNATELLKIIKYVKNKKKIQKNKKQILINDK